MERRSFRRLILRIEEEWLLPKRLSCSQTDRATLSLLTFLKAITNLAMHKLLSVAWSPWKRQKELESFHWTELLPLPTSYLTSPVRKVIFYSTTFPPRLEIVAVAFVPWLCGVFVLFCFVSDRFVLFVKKKNEVNTIMIKKEKWKKKKRRKKEKKKKKKKKKKKEKEEIEGVWVRPTIYPRPTLDDHSAIPSDSWRF